MEWLQSSPIGDGPNVWRRVIGMKEWSHPVIGPLYFDIQGFVIEDYDLQGLPLTRWRTQCKVDFKGETEI